MCAVNKPKLREKKIDVMVRFVKCKIKAGRSPCENERGCKKETGAKPSRQPPVFATEWCQKQKRRDDGAKCTRNNLVKIIGIYDLTGTR